MPTGTGKTGVMVILSYAMSANKVLVITPSQLVREQIVENFRNPKILIDKGIIQGGRKLPKVYELTTTIDEKKVWDKILKDHDVIVGIPVTIDKIINQDHCLEKDAFDLVFVDEAHHSRANSWANILTYFSQAKQVLLTATPFRRDNKNIKARLVYNYPLKLAFEEKLFSKINFIPVNTQLFSTPDDKNIAIAKKAENIYNSRLHKDHRIIIRTDRRKDADQLFDIYCTHTQLKLVVIHSKLGSSTIKSRIKELSNGEIDGVICVDMMGEGYDFPALKIAAVHIPHKSLAITLQFVGRISRTNTAEGNVATLIAGEHEFKIDSHQLYKEDSKDWSLVLPDLHKLKIQKTEDEQEFFDSFEDLTETQESLPIEYEEPISLEDDDLSPFFHAKVYQIISTNLALRENAPIDIQRSIDFSGTEILKNPVVRHHHISPTYEVAVYIVSELKKPEWYTKDEKLKDVKNELFVIYFDKANSMLFIGATIKEMELYEHIALQYLEPGVLHDMIPMPQLKRSMAGWHEPKLYNFGMKSRKTRGNSESYKQVMGSMAQMSVLPSDKYSYTRGHSFGGAFDTVLNKNVLLGISTSSKVWALEDNKIKYFVEWCTNIARKVGDPEMDKLVSPLSDLDSGIVVDSFPDEQIFFADWDSKQYYHFTSIVFLNEDEEPVSTVLICSCNIKVIQQTESVTILSISKDAISCKINYTLKPKVNFEYATDTPHKLGIAKGSSYGSTTSFLYLLNESPINLFYDNLSKLVGRVLFEFNKDNLRTINNNQFIAHKWPTNVNTFKEFYSTEESMSGLNNTKISIHEYIIEQAKSEYDAVFYDHGSLEIADVIGLKKGKIQFWHCKKQNEPEPNCSINDIYEVCGQAVKSVNWANRKLLISQIYDRADQNNSSNKIKKGTLQLIKEILASFDNPILPVEITIVQPGLKTQNLNYTQKPAFDRIKLLLSGAESFLKDVSSCSLSILCS
jgi:superfamily II DNA or RNA helicase